MDEKVFWSLNMGDNVYVGSKPGFGFGFGTDICQVGPSGSSLSGAVVVSEFEGSLDESSGVVLRMMNPATYKQYPVELEEKWRVFKVESGFDMSGFLLKNKRLASVSLRSGSNDPKLEEEFVKILKSVKLK